VLRRLVVATIAGALVLGAMPPRAFAASDDWRPLDDHYRCVWRCRERARLFRTSPKPVAPKVARPTKAPAVVTRAEAPDRYSGSGFGPFSWLTSLFGDRSWRTSTRYEDRPCGDDWRYRNDGWGWGNRRGWDDYRWHNDDRWSRDDPWGWDDWHHGWDRRPRYRDNWSWDDGRDSGYTAHRHHPRGDL
jgi:hypothetical protein